MANQIPGLLTFLASASAFFPAAGSAADYPLKTVSYNDVEMTSGFWRPRMITQRKTLLPWAFERTVSGVAHLQAAADFLNGRSVEVEQDGEWRPFDLYTPDKYDTRATQYNVVHPAAPLNCDAIRINRTPREGMAMGLLEVQVQFEE